MPHPAILGRRLDKPVINLGFSGNGRMEPEVGALLTEIDAAVYVIDCLPNMTEPEVAERAEALVRQLREARPDTPIVLVEDRTYTNAWIMKSKRDRHAGSRSAFVRAYDNLVKSGVKGLTYVEGEGLLGDDTEGTTDGSHPNDLGFMRQADALEPHLRKALGMK
jgi:lysophospholipase L1-like esterase